MVFDKSSSNDSYRSLSSASAAFEVSRVSCANCDLETSEVIKACVRLSEEVTSLEEERSRSSCVALGSLRGPRRPKNSVFLRAVWEGEDLSAATLG